MCFDYVVYMLFCQNGHFYTGYTNDLMRRYAAHLAGKCKYTRSFKPVRIAQYWQVTGTKADALRVERYIKSLSRVEKETLVIVPDQLLVVFDYLRSGPDFNEKDG